MPGLTWLKTPTRTDQNEQFLHFSLEDKHLTVLSIEIFEKVKANKWRPVKSDTENSLYASMNNFDKVY